MSKQIKLSEEDLSKIREIRISYSDTINQLGQLDLQIHDLRKLSEQLANNRNDILSKYDKIKETEKKVLDEISQKYGIGTLNIESGILELSDNNPS